MSESNSPVVDLGFTSARQFWSEVVVVAHRRFEAAPTRANAFEAASSAWHLHEWVWFEEHPEMITDGTPPSEKYEAALVAECPPLGWLKDITNAGKHRHLRRPKKPRSFKVEAMRDGDVLTDDYGFALTDDYDDPLLADVGFHIKLKDGTRHDVAHVLVTVMQFWERRFAA